MSNIKTEFKIKLITMSMIWNEMLKKQLTTQNAALISHKSFKLLTLKQRVDENVSLHDYSLGTSETFNQVTIRMKRGKFMEACNN